MEVNIDYRFPIVFLTFWRRDSTIQPFQGFNPAYYLFFQTPQYIRGYLHSFPLGISIWNILIKELSSKYYQLLTA